MESKTGKNSSITIIYVALFILVPIPILLFVINFHNQSISTLSSSWSELGSYVGGIVGAVIALANLIVLIKLAKIADKIQDVNNDKERTFKRKLLVAEIQNNLIKNVTETLFSPLSTFESFQKGDPNEEIDFEDLKSVISNNLFLIKRFASTNDDVFSNIDTSSLTKIIEEALEKNDEKSFVKFVLNEYEEACSIFIKDLRKKMIYTLDL